MKLELKELNSLDYFTPGVQNVVFVDNILKCDKCSKLKYLALLCYGPVSFSVYLCLFVACLFWG